MDLSTYEGRRAAWADELESGKYTQATGTLRRKVDDPGGVKRCCCLGVASEMICELEPTLLERREVYGASAYEYKATAATLEKPDSSPGFLTMAAAEWLGFPHTWEGTRPTAELDEQFVREFAAEQEERLMNGHDALSVASDAMGAVKVLQVGDQVTLHILNDSGVPWPMIAGLIRRECLIDAKTGAVA